jgi:hypothetical protein
VNWNFEDKGFRYNSRFKTDEIGHPVHLVALAVGLGPHLADLVEELDALEPFFGSEVYLSGEIVQVANGRGEDLLETRAGVGAACVDNVLCEVLVVLVSGRRGGAVCLGGHCGAVYDVLYCGLKVGGWLTGGWTGCLMLS